MGGAEGNETWSHASQDAVAERARSQDPTERWAAAIELSELGGAAAVAELRRLAEDPDELVRRAAQDCLKRVRAEGGIDSSKTKLPESTGKPVDGALLAGDSLETSVLRLIGQASAPLLANEIAAIIGRGLGETVTRSQVISCLHCVLLRQGRVQQDPSSYRWSLAADDAKADRAKG